jgi:DNA polymerase-3 subunit gamma/tau
VSTVLGLVGRDLLFDLIDAVANEDGPRAFALADQAVESGHDLKLVVRDLARVVRDIMILSVDPARAGDGELAEGELERLKQLAGRFSREDLLRAFDVLAKAEQDLRVAAHPRYHFEMALLRWMHVRKLVPLADVLEQFGSVGGANRATPAAAPRAASTAGRPPAPPPAPARQTSSASPASAASTARPPGRTAADREPPVVAGPQIGGGGGLKDALLAEIRAAKSFFYNTVVAQAQSIEVSGDKVAFTFLPTHRTLREQFEQTRPWIEAAAERITGRKVSVVSQQADAGAAPATPASSPPPAAGQSPNGKKDLKAEAMATPAVQAVLEVFPAEIKDVEEL